MGLFSRKPKYSMEEFCRYFYDSHVFNPNIGGVKADFYEGLFNIVVGADESFKSIDFNKFREQMTAIRMELFGLAWADKFKREQVTIPQSFFTKRYLEETEMLQIWDYMGAYNQVIANSATMTETGEQVGQVKGGVGGTEAIKVNLLRTNMFDNWVKINVGNKDTFTKEEKERLTCVARVAFRIGADIRRHDCVAVKVVAIELAERLGCAESLNSGAMFRLGAIIFGFYNGARTALNDVDIQM